MEKLHIITLFHQTITLLLDTKPCFFSEVTSMRFCMLSKLHSQPWMRAFPRVHRTGDPGGNLAVKFTGVLLKCLSEWWHKTHMGDLDIWFMEILISPFLIEFHFSVSTLRCLHSAILFWIITLDAKWCKYCKSPNLLFPFIIFCGWTTGQTKHFGGLVLAHRPYIE